MVVEISCQSSEKSIGETQNVIKANNLCNGELTIPDDKDAISQRRIFESQLSQFIIPKDEVTGALPFRCGEGRRDVRCF